MDIILKNITDEELHQLLTELTDAEKLGVQENTLLREFMKQLKPNVAIIQAPIEIYKEAASRWYKTIDSNPLSF